MLPKFNFSYFAKIVQIAVHDLIILCGLFYEALELRVFESGVIGLGRRN
jgi:hypothetical protein